jgi:hypothetical protein
MTARSSSQVIPHAPLRWQRELLYVTIALMETVWCILLFLAFSPDASRLSTPAIAALVFGNLLASVGLVRLLIYYHLPYNVYRWIVLMGIIAACALDLFVILPINAGSVPLIIRSLSARTPSMVPPQVIAVAAIVFLWFRGIRIATSVITPVRANFGFRVGILIMLVICILPDARIQSDLIRLLPMFFFAGLLATSVARAASLRINRTAQRTTFGGRWLGFTGVLGASVSATGFLIALLLAGYGVEGAARILKGILGAVYVVFLVVATPLLYVLDWLLRPIAEMLHSVSLDFSNPSLQNQFTPLPGDPVGADRLSQLAMLLDLLKYLCLGIIVIAVVAVLFALLRNRAMNTSADGEEHENLENDGLLNSLRRGLQALQNSLVALRQFGPGRDLLDALTIRRLYARLIGRAADLGFPRDQAQTPFEYQEKLRVAFPGFPVEIDMVTRAYVNVHYGELPESREALSAVQDAVERMIASVETNNT